MSLPKWSKNDLLSMKDSGYKIIKCDSELEAEDIKHTLRINRRCAQSGRIVDKDNNSVFFVVTKEREK